MFRRHIFPQPIDRLLDLARAENDDIARAALVALSNVVDSRVRALGLDLITGLKWRGFAVGLLVRNAEHGDYGIIEGLLREDIDSLRPRTQLRWDCPCRDAYRAVPRRAACLAATRYSPIAAPPHLRSTYSGTRSGALLRFLSISTFLSVEH